MTSTLQMISNIVNPSAQTDEHNASLSQGVGFGKRADYTDGHSWAGRRGVFSAIRKGMTLTPPGSSPRGVPTGSHSACYWDGSGHDSYSGVWYVQGSGAHFAVGYLDDFDGNDTYSATHNMAVGAGHDFTVGFLNERAGNDIYTVPNLSLGGGNANGIGLFHDHSGDDQYNTSAGTTLGRANASSKGIRSFLQVFGIFIDGGGNDTYSEPYATNGSKWISPASNKDEPNRLEIGVGIDF